MNWITFKRVIKLGFINFYRNIWLSVATTLVMSLTLVIISIFVIFNIAIKTTSDSLKDRVNISVYFNDSATEEQINIIKRQLEKRDDVVSVNYVSKEETLAIWQGLSINDRIRDIVTSDSNPLPRSLEIKAHDLQNLEEINKFLSKEEYKNLVRKVDYQENKLIIKKLNDVISFSIKLGLILSGVFIAISIFVILNTVKLAIITRKDEIEIMRLVGANNLFIRIPFFIEGILYGMISAVLSIIIVASGIKLLAPFANQYLEGQNINFASFFLDHIWLIILLEVLVSITISVICSFISIQKYLRT